MLDKLALRVDLEDLSLIRSPLVPEVSETGIRA
jgi:hypothetical protein